MVYQRWQSYLDSPQSASKPRGRYETGEYQNCELIVLILQLIGRAGLLLMECHERKWPLREMDYAWNTCICTNLRR